MAVPETFINLIDNALKHCRRVTRYGDWSLLSRTELVQFELIQQQVWQEERHIELRQAAIVYAVLRWAVERLRPNGVLDWHAGRWRAYLLIRSVYFGDLTFEQVAERVGVSESALYFTRRKAVTLLATFLWEANQGQSADCRRYVLQQRLAGISAETQTLLKALAAFDTPLPLTHIQTIQIYWPIDDIQPLLTTLREQHFALVAGDRWQIRPVVREFVCSILSESERQIFYAVVGEYYAVQGDYLRAATAERYGSNAPKATTLLLEHQDALLKQGAGEALQQQLTQLLDEVVEVEPLAKIHIALGDIAFQQSHLSNALAAYEQALTAPDVPTRALAYYKHATALRRRQIDAALISYQRTVELMEGFSAEAPLLLRTYLELAHLYIQEQNDLDEAERNLDKATAIIDEGDRHAFAQLHDMLGTLSGRRGQAQAEIRHYLQAYLASVEVQDNTLMMRVAHNLGLAYTWSERFEEGQLYVQKAQSLAQRSEDRQMQATCHKTLGVNHFLQGQFEASTAEYEVAYQLFETLGNQNWLAALACDLTESYAAAGDAAQTQHNFANAKRLIAETGIESLQQNLDQIAQQYPHMLPSRFKLNARQQIGFAYATQHGSIDKRTYAKIANTSPKTAYRDLQALAETGLLKRTGQGRSTVYVRHAE